MMNEVDIIRAGAAGLAPLYKEGVVTPTGVAKLYIQRIAKYNRQLNAFLHSNERLAAEAQASTKRWKAGLALSDLDGVPIAVKSNIAVKGLPWDGGIGAYRHRIADEDAEVVKRLKKAGALIIGTLNMEEGALGARTDNPWFGPTWNPHREGYTPGGSSGGSGAAVAAGLCAAALGTDTMGSVRIPSAYCGVYGLKPAAGTIPDAGLVPLSPTLDTIGCHGRTLADVHLLYAGLVDAPRPKALPKRVAVLDWQNQVAVEPGVAKSFQNVLTTLEKLDVSCRKVTFDGYEFGKTRINGLIVSEIEGYKAHREAMAKDPDGFSSHLTSLFQYGAGLSPERVEEAYRSIKDAAAFNAVWAEDEALILPTAPQTAFLMEELPANQADFTAFANVTGLPALSVPAGLSGEGLPHAFQIVGRKGEEGALFALAEHYAQATKQDMRPQGYDY